MDYDKVIQIKKPEFGDELQEEKDFDLNSIYNQAIHNYPQLQVADLNEKTALLDVRLERSSYYPSLSGFVSLDSRFSTKVMQINGEPIISLSSGQPVSINGVDAEIAFYQPSFSLKKTPYFDQIKDNFGQAVGVSLSVPIFNNLRTKSNVELAKLGRKKAEIAKKEIENQLRADLSKTINDLNASKKQFFATQKTKIAAKNAYNNAEKKYDLGSISSLELLSAKNNLEKASSNFIMAKYNYLFNKKILDYYTKGVIQF